MPAGPAFQVPDADKIVLLVRTSLLTLNDALQSGNFSVMRDRAAPAFQTANTAARLSQIFADLMGHGLDLSAVAIMVPTLTATPTVDAQNHLHIAGFFPGQPVGIAFDLLYEVVAGQWRLFAISANAVPTSPSITQGSPPANAGAGAEVAKKGGKSGPAAPKTKQ